MGPLKGASPKIFLDFLHDFVVKMKGKNSIEEEETSKVGKNVLSQIPNERVVGSFTVSDLHTSESEGIGSKEEVIVEGEDFEGQSIRDSLSDLATEDFLEEVEKKQGFLGKFPEVLGIGEKNIAEFQKGVEGIIGLISKQSKEEEENPSELTKKLKFFNIGLAQFSLVLDAAKLPFYGIKLIARTLYLYGAKKQLARVEEKIASATDEKEIEKLRKQQRKLERYIKLNQDSVKIEGLGYGLRSASFIRGGLAAASSFTKKIPTQVGHALSIVGPILGILKSGLDLFLTAKASHAHKAWMKNKRFEDQARPFPSDMDREVKLTQTAQKEVEFERQKEEVIQETGSRLSFDVEGPPEEATNVVDYVERLLRKREKIMEQRMDENRDRVEALYKKIDGLFVQLDTLGDQEILDEHFESLKQHFKEFNIDEKLAKVHFEQSIQQLKKNNYSNPIQLKEEIVKEYLKIFRLDVEKAREDFNQEKVDSIEEALLKQYCEFSDAMAITTRNAFKTLAKEKPRIEKKFFDFKLAKSSTMFSLAVITGVAAIVLQILSWVGVVPGFAAIIPGLIPIAVGAAFVGIGLFMFYKYKPNYAKEIFKGKKILATLERFPLSFQQLRHSLRKVELNETAAKIDAKINKLNKLNRISEGNLSEKDEKLKTKLESEIKKLTEKRSQIEENMQKLTGKVEYWEKKVEALESSLRNAAAKDFARSIKRDTQQEEKDLYEDLVDGLVSGEWERDPETIKILKDQMGINLKKVAQATSTSEENFKEDLNKSIKTFFSMGTTALTDFIKKQNVRFKVREQQFKEI